MPFVSFIGLPKSRDSDYDAGIILSFAPSQNDRNASRVNLTSVDKIMRGRIRQILSTLSLDVTNAN